MKPIVIFGTCRERVAYWEHIDSVLAAQRYLVARDISVGMVYASSTYIREGRKGIVDKFLAMPDATHLCFVDSDNMLHERTIWRLLQHDKPIVSALYFKRKGMPEAVAFRWSDKTYQSCYSDSQRIRDWMITNAVEVKYESQIIDTLAKPLLKTGVVGFGAVLLQRKVLETLVEKYGDVFGGHDADVGEDVYFCKLAAQENIKVYLDMGNIVGHLGHYNVTLHDFMQVPSWEKGE